MKVCKGDRIVIRGHRSGEPSRDCEVVDVRGVDGAPPYFVRWEDSGRVALFFPGPDAAVEHYDHARGDLDDADREMVRRCGPDRHS